MKNGNNLTKPNSRVNGREIDVIARGGAFSSPPGAIIGGLIGFGFGVIGGVYSYF